MMGARAKMAGDPRAAMKMKSALKRTDIKLFNVDDMGNETSREISKEEFDGKPKVKLKKKSGDRKNTRRNLSLGGRKEWMERLVNCSCCQKVRLGLCRR